MSYAPDPARYDAMPYRRCGRSGVKLPAISLGLWHNFGDEHPLETQRAILRRAFDLGITHFDLANNYGPPYGSAESNFGRILSSDFAAHRDELFLSTKAGWDMWPGPYGEFGSRKYLLSSLDQSLKRMGVDYVDVFYSHRFDPHTPLEETMGALATAVTSGRALYAGISSYSPERTREAAAILRSLGTPLLIHQPSYSMLNRWIEGGLLDTLSDIGAGCIAFSPLAQGMLTSKYLNGIPAGSRMAEGSSLSTSFLSEQNLAHIRALNEIAAGREQSLAQLALAWALRDERVTSVLIGASSVEQLQDSVAALQRTDFSAGELRRDRRPCHRGRGRSVADQQHLLTEPAVRHGLDPVLLAGFVLTGMTMRTAVTSVGAVLDELQAGLHDQRRRGSDHHAAGDYLRRDWRAHAVAGASARAAPVAGAVPRGGDGRHGGARGGRLGLGVRTVEHRRAQWWCGLQCAAAQPGQATRADRDRADDGDLLDCARGGHHRCVGADRADRRPGLIAQRLASRPRRLGGAQRGRDLPVAAHPAS